ncbi:MAG: phosphatase PAP2 family protein [Actinomycetes bacterium]
MSARHPVASSFTTSAPPALRADRTLARDRGADPVATRDTAADAPVELWRHAAWRALPWILLLAFLSVLAQVAAGDGLVHLDMALRDRLVSNGHWIGMTLPWRRETMDIAMLGQRGPTAVVGFAVAGWLAWRRRLWRPLLVMTASVLALNVVIGGLKILTDRPQPITGDPYLLAGGMQFPSGHASNVLLTWGVIAYLLWRYGQPRLPRAVGAGVVGVFSVAVALCSLYLGMHWLTDLIAGYLMAGLLLYGVVRLDAHPAPSGRFAQAVQRFFTVTDEAPAPRPNEPAPRPHPRPYA